MKSYIKVKWIHSFPNDPVWLYSELDENRLEIRKVEIYADGRIGYANKESEAGGTALSDEPIPPLRDIAADPQFEPSIISMDEFYEIWIAAVGNGL